MADILGLSKSAVSSAATGAKKLDDWGREAEQALADGKSVNMFKKALAGVTFFGQANAALQVLGMGLTLVAMIQGQKSEEDLILDGVNEIIGRMTTLNVALASQFKAIETALNVATGKLGLQLALNPVNSAKTCLDQIGKARKNGKPFDTLLKQLAQFNTTVFEDAMTQIHDSCIGTGTAPNVLAETYRLTYGDLNEVWKLAEYLQHEATLALMLHGTVACIQAKTANEDVDLSQIAALYQDQLVEVADAVGKYVALCTDPAEIERNVTRFVTDNRTGLDLRRSDKQTASDRLADALQARYRYLNFSVIVYEPLSGFDHHGFAGQNVASLFRFADVTNAPMNIVVFWATTTPTNRQAQITWASAIDRNANPRKDRTFDLSFTHKPPGARYQFVFGLASRANLSTNNSPFYGDWGHIHKDLSPIFDDFNNETDRTKREDGSLLWFGWTDQWDSADTQTDIGFTSYNAMYGVVSPYVSICLFPD